MHTNLRILHDSFHIDWMSWGLLCNYEASLRLIFLRNWRSIKHKLPTSTITIKRMSTKPIAEVEAVSRQITNDKIRLLRQQELALVKRTIPWVWFFSHRLVFRHRALNQHSASHGSAAGRKDHCECQEILLMRWLGGTGGAPVHQSTMDQLDCIDDLTDSCKKWQSSNQNTTPSHQSAGQWSTELIHYYPHNLHRVKIRTNQMDGR